MAKTATRPTLIIGNWKMYKTIEQALEYIEKIAPVAEKSQASCMLAVPYTAIKSCAEKAEGTKVIIGAQNMNDAMEGAFTGEVAAVMLKEAGARFVLIGQERSITKPMPRWPAKCSAPWQVSFSLYFAWERPLKSTRRARPKSC
jgi:hypothetical protein